MKISETVIAPLIAAIGCATIYLLCLAFIFDDDFMKNYGPDIINGFISGGMTVFAGWLAFREARRANDYMAHKTITEQQAQTHEYLQKVEEAVMEIFCIWAPISCVRMSLETHKKTLEGIITKHGSNIPKITNTNIRSEENITIESIDTNIDEVYDTVSAAQRKAKELKSLLDKPSAYEFKKCKELYSHILNPDRRLPGFRNASPDNYAVIQREVEVVTEYIKKAETLVKPCIKEARSEIADIIKKSTEIANESAEHILKP